MSLTKVTSTTREVKPGSSVNGFQEGSAGGSNLRLSTRGRHLWSRSPHDPSGAPARYAVLVSELLRFGQWPFPDLFLASISH